LRKDTIFWAKADGIGAQCANMLICQYANLLMC